MGEFGATERRVLVRDAGVRGVAVLTGRLRSSVRDLTAVLMISAVHVPSLKKKFSR